MAQQPQQYTIGGAAGLRLHLNEFRFPHAPAVAEALGAAVAAAGFAAEYPSEETAAEAERLVAGFLGLAPECVAVSAGSDEALRAVAEMFAIRHRGAGSGAPRALVAVPCYTHFRLFVERLGYAQTEVDLDVTGGGRGGAALFLPHHDALVAGALVYVGSPNNPTGQLWDADTVCDLSTRYPRSLFIVDEAYAEFAGVAAALAAAGPETGTTADGAARAQLLGAGRAREIMNQTTLAPLASAADNVVVTRTFSKAFGLAALRVGYLVGAPETVAAARAGLSPKAVGRPQVAAVRAVLGALDHYLAATAGAILAAEEAQLEVARAGFYVVPAPANFFLVYVGDAAAARAFFHARGVAIRDRSALPGLRGFVRVSAGTPADLARVVAVFRELRAGGEAPPLPIQRTFVPKARIGELRYLVARALYAFNAAAAVCARRDPAAWAGRRAAALARADAARRRKCGEPPGEGEGEGESECAEAAEAYWREVAAATPRPWAVAGTLLGLRRHGGQIPWDDDADFGYALVPGFPDPETRDAPVSSGLDVLALPAARDAFAQAGLTLQRNRTGAYWQAGTNAPGATISPVHVDFFPFRLERTETLRGTDLEWVCADPRFAREAPGDGAAHCNVRLRAGELFPLRPARYYDEAVAVPAAADAVLTRALGPGWERLARVRHGGGVGDFVLAPEDCRPA